MRMLPIGVAALALAAATLVASGAQAQRARTPAPAPARPAAARPAAAAPAPQPAIRPGERAIRGDWNVGCSGESAAEVCDAVQSMVDTTTRAERVRVSIARRKASGDYGLQIKTPLGFRLDTGAMLRFSESPGDAIEDIKFNRCVPDGCYAERPVTAAELAKLRNAGKIELVFLDLAGQPMIVALSVAGIREAVAAL